MTNDYLDHVECPDYVGKCSDNLAVFKIIFTFTADIYFMEQQQSTLPKNAIVIDVDFFNKSLPNLKNFLSNQMKRDMPDMDLAYFCAQLGLMMGVSATAPEEFMVILISDNALARLADCSPSAVADIDNRATDVGCWRFNFCSFNSAGMSFGADRIFEIVDVVFCKEEIERVFLVPDETLLPPPYVHKYLEIMKNCFGAEKFKNKSFCMGGLQEASRFQHLDGLPYVNLTIALSLGMGLSEQEILMLKNSTN